MNRKEKSNFRDIGNKNYSAKKVNSSENSKKLKDKDLPWWVELLFVQLGLPDKLLIKILKTKRKCKDLINNDKNLLLKCLFIISILAYFYPVIKNAKNNLDCAAIAKNYITANKKIILTSKKELKMLSTNFCYGGKEIYEIENLNK